jgi:hypothetical protein
MTLTTWKRDPAFLAQIKHAVSARLYKRLQKIDAGEQGWQGCGWLLERLYFKRFAKPEVLMQVTHNTLNQVNNTLVITAEVDEISDQLEEDAGSRHDLAIMPQIPSGFDQNRGILFLAKDSGVIST